MRYVLIMLLALLMPPPYARAATVKLAWDASPSPEVAYYVIWRGSSPGGPYSFVAQIPASLLVYTDITPNVNQTFYYVLTAKAATGEESGYSNEVFFVSSVVVEPPRNLRKG
jgi:fibronectin type 3 domain-containing protein